MLKLAFGESEGRNHFYARRSARRREWAGRRWRRPPASSRARLRDHAPF